MNIGLVLSGGMAKGAYQIGALRAINTFIPPCEVKYISCASVGVLNGYAYATGKLDHAEALWKTLCAEHSRILISQMLKSSLLQQNIAGICDSKDRIASHFYCSLFDPEHRSIVYKDLRTVVPNQIPLYLKASVAMPIYNRSVQIENISYFDGAMIDNIPVYPLLKHSLDYLICIYFDDVCYKFENTYFDNKIIKIIFPAQNRLKQSVLFQHEEIDRMITDGYERAAHLLKTVFQNGYENSESIYHAIDSLNRTSKKRLRLTGDMLVTNLNKITQKLTKRKIL